MVSVTHSFKRNLVARGIDGDKIHVVTNGVDGSRFHQMPKDAELAAELNIERCFVAGYIGTHGMAHALNTLLDAAAVLDDDPHTQHIRILFLGDGAAREGLMVRAKDMGLTNVIFRASVPRDAVPGYWSLLDVALIHLRHTELFSTVIPSKIFECMGMGIPIVLGVEGEAAEIISTRRRDNNRTRNYLQLAKQLKILSGEPQSLKEMSSAGGLRRKHTIGPHLLTQC